MKMYCVKCHKHFEAARTTKKVKGKTIFAVAKHPACGTTCWRIVGRK